MIEAIIVIAVALVVLALALTPIYLYELLLEKIEYNKDMNTVENAVLANEIADLRFRTTMAEMAATPGYLENLSELNWDEKPVVDEEDNILPFPELQELPNPMDTILDFDLDTDELEA